MPVRRVAADSRAAGLVPVGEESGDPWPRRWAARLELGYARAATGTVPVLRRHCGPLRSLRHRIDPTGLLEQVLVHPPGGIAGGDELEYVLDLGRGSDVQLTSVGAAKWYQGSGRAARQSLLATLAPGARLAWLPLENILYSGASATIEARFELAGDATLFCADVVCLGRPECAERFDEGCWSQRTDVVRDGRLIWCERVHFEAQSVLADSPAGLAGCPVVGTILYAGAPLPTALHATVRGLTVDGYASATQLPDVWLARYLGSSTESAQRWLRAVRALVHPHTHGYAAREPRIWST